MQFASGATRAVILTEKYAIKFARFRVIRSLTRLLLHSSNGEVGNRLRKFDDNPLMGGIKYFFAGVLANRNEALVWENYGSNILAPTLWSFFGLVNVQIRGLSVSNTDLNSHVIRKLLKRFPVEDDDTMGPEQFCRINGSIVLCDYGRLELTPALSAYIKIKNPVF